MLSRSASVRCASAVSTTASTTANTEVMFRRVFSSQFTVLDIIPVKKPLVEGSLTWLLLDQLQLVLVSGVKGTSSEEVAETVKHRAVSFLANSGGGDALIGHQSIRQSVLQSTNLQRFMDKLDLHVRLVLSESLCSSKKLCCAVYVSDPWEPHQQERHLTDIVSSLTQLTVEQIIRSALAAVLREAQTKSRQLIEDTVRESRLVLRTAPSELEPSTMGEGPALVPLPRYELDVEFVRVREEKENGKVFYNGIAASWVLRDDAENVESCDVPFVPLRDTRGLLHRFGPSQSPPLDAPALSRLSSAGAVTRDGAADGSESLRGVLRSLWRRPLLHARLLRASPPVRRARAEDFVDSCGRAAVSAWLCARCRAGRVPPLLPLLGAAPAPGAALRAGLRHELGSRGEARAEAGPLKFFFALADTPSGRVATPVGGFASAAAALSALLPWHAALPTTHARGFGSWTEVRNGAGAPSSLGAIGSSTADIGKDPKETPCVEFRVIDLQETLRRMGVTVGELSEDVLIYRDASGKQVFRFESMNTLPGVERFVRRLRRSKEPCFLTVRLAQGSRNFRVLWVKAFGDQTSQKAPPYVKYIRVAVPLVPGHHFSLRFKGLYSRDVVTHGLLNMLRCYSEDPSQWQLLLKSPCFFNMWKLTRSSIHSITLQDPQFRFTVEHQNNLPQGMTGKEMNSDCKEENRRVVLRFFSGEVLKSETILKKNFELADAHQCFSEYAVKQGCRVQSVFDTVFPQEFSTENPPSSYRGIVTSMLNNSEIFIQKTDEVRLEVQITNNVNFLLSKSTDVTVTKESLCMMFVSQQFPSILPAVEKFLHVHKFFCAEKKQKFRCLNIAGSYRWEFVEGDRVIQSFSGHSSVDVLTELVNSIEPSSIDAPKSTFGRDNSQSSGNSRSAKENVAYYQYLLEKKYGVTNVFHEYDAKKRIFSIIGGAHHQKGVVLRRLRLDNGTHLMDIIHRYYRWLLGASPPSLRLSDASLRTTPLNLIFSRCQQFFSTPLPKLEESITFKNVSQAWLATLSLPGALFGLDTEFNRSVHAQTKNEARRNVVCLLYKALYDPLSPELVSFFQKKSEVPLVAAPKNSARPRNGTASMISDLEQIVITHLREHAGYDGFIQYQLSHLTGITGRFLPHSPNSASEGESVELFHRFFQSNALAPLQVLEALVSCAGRLVPEADLREELSDVSSAWPSLFIDAKRNERLFCTTCLRRYMGLWTFEANDVDEMRVRAPGTLYLVERTHHVADTLVEASLSIVQTPLKPHMGRFIKSLSSHRSSDEKTALMGMWGNVARHFVSLQGSLKQGDMDVAILNSVICKDR